MNIVLNGEVRVFSGTLLADLVDELSLATGRGLAIAVNDEVKPRALWDQLALKENDNVLIIKATQGG